jgi:hypothetical protein
VRDALGLIREGVAELLAIRQNNILIDLARTGSKRVAKYYRDRWMRMFYLNFSEGGLFKFEKRREFCNFALVVVVVGGVTEPWSPYTVFGGGENIGWRMEDATTEVRDLVMLVKMVD